MDRDTYLGYLETDYYQRVTEEHAAESGLFGRVDAPRWLDPELMEAKGDGALKLDSYLSNRIGEILEDDKILTQIDNEIKRITDSDKNDKAKKKNMK